MNDTFCVSPFRKRHLLNAFNFYTESFLPLDAALRDYYRGNRSLGSHDRKIISQCLFDLVRWQGRLDAVASKPVSLEKRLDLLIAGGGKPPAMREGEEYPPHIVHSFPKDLFDTLVADYGLARASSLCKASNTQAPITVRTNTLRITREKLIEKFKEIGFNAKPTPHSPWGVILSKREPLANLDAFQEGLFEIQDEGSQELALFTEARKKMHVLDFCAGSGGKSLAMAQMMENSGQLYLHDIRESALKNSTKRLKRAGVFNAQTCSPGTLEPLIGKMDIVVVDLPCSGTGTIRRNPDMKWRFSKEWLKELQLTQIEIATLAAKYVKPGGKLIYMTCSLLKDENERQIEKLKHLLNADPIHREFSSAPDLPGRSSDGFYGACLTLSKKPSPATI